MRTTWLVSGIMVLMAAGCRLSSKKSAEEVVEKPGQVCFDVAQIASLGKSTDLNAFGLAGVEAGLTGQPGFELTRLGAVATGGAPYVYVKHCKADGGDCHDRLMTSTGMVDPAATGRRVVEFLPCQMLSDSPRCPTAARRTVHHLEDFPLCCHVAAGKKASTLGGKPFQGEAKTLWDQQVQAYETYQGLYLAAQKAAADVIAAGGAFEGQEYFEAVRDMPPETSALMLSQVWDDTSQAVARAGSAEASLNLASSGGRTCMARAQVEALQAQPLGLTSGNAEMRPALTMLTLAASMMAGQRSTVAADAEEQEVRFAMEVSDEKWMLRSEASRSTATEFSGGAGTGNTGKSWFKRGWDWARANKGWVFLGAVAATVIGVVIWQATGLTQEQTARRDAFARFNSAVDNAAKAREAFLRLDVKRQEVAPV